MRAKDSIHCACSVSPANRNHAGVCTRTSQSIAIHARVSSSASVVRVPITSGSNGRNSVVRVGSGNASFHDRRNAAITGDTPCG
jgi:hypothetical protein